jgi:hypothetical protein
VILQPKQTGRHGDGLPARAWRMQVAPIDLVAGDMYFWRSDTVHEVPGLMGDKAHMYMGAALSFARPRPISEHH